MIAIIGGSGFIGSRLSFSLASAGLSFRIVDINKSMSFPDNWVFGDVTKPDTLTSALSGSDIIINLAAEHKDNVSPISLYYDVNVQGAKMFAIQQKN